MKAATAFSAALISAAHATTGSHDLQAHISLTGKAGEMFVAFAKHTDSDDCPSHEVKYGPKDADTTKTKRATGHLLKASSLCNYGAVLTELEADKEYAYSIASAAGSLRGVETTTSSEFTFKTASGDSSTVYALLADFGLSNDVSIEQLKAEAAAGEFDVLIHAGDFAYNLEDSNGATGNSFMNAMQPVVSRIPYMTAPGNHESDGNTFAQYLGRFPATKVLAENSGSKSQLWYSFDHGKVHWISVDTELWAYGGTPEQIAAQHAWLESDLQNIDRTKTPWVIAFGHKQDWMDGGGTNFKTLEALMNQYGVDLYFCGHQHNYQRLAPYNAGRVSASCMPNNGTYSDCDTMISIVVGSPGCREKLSHTHAPHGIVKFESEYGYGHLTVVDETTAEWTWEQIGARDLQTGKVVNSARVVDKAIITRSAPFLGSRAAKQQ